MSKCNSCGAPLIWIKTSRGKNMPCNAEPVVYWQKTNAPGRIVTKNGMILSCEFTGELGKATGIGYVSHWATCPDAGRFRKK